MKTSLQWGSDDPAHAVMLNYEETTAEDVEEMERLFLMWTARLRSALAKSVL